MTRQGAAILVAAVGVVIACAALGIAIVVWAEPYSKYPNLAETFRSADERHVLGAILQVLWTFYALASVALPPERLPRWMRPRPHTRSTAGATYFTLVMAVALGFLVWSSVATVHAIGLSDEPLLRASAFRTLPLGLGMYTLYLGILALRLNPPPAPQPAVA